MSTIKSSDEHLTLNADGSSKDIKFQANGVEKASISSAGAFTSTTIDATKLTGTIPNFTSTGINDNATSTAIIIDANKNVGIGVGPETWDSQYTALQVGGGASITGSTDGDNLIVSANMYETGGVQKYIKSSKLASQHQQNNGTHTFSVAPLGTADAAISWTNPLEINNSTIEIGGGFNASGGSRGIQVDDNWCRFRFSNNGTGTQEHLRFYNNNGLVGQIHTSGSSTTYQTSSDYRLKENVDYTWDATTRLKQLKPARFNFIADDSVTVDGFLAHEVSDIVPEAVNGEKDAVDSDGNIDPQGIDQSKLVPLLVKTIQELEARIAALES